ncbi:DUSAM domain-containing protein [Pyxidicoccus parkwayensis]|uniref:DUSAM domain-containing protein n=1 Tax=Pyxidicoccus parkwayensis TaxID=2813578 RepID=A0ABX7NTC0_9BACT|nr:DUF2379 family protein [Pyxidicoccus parkwaysis]QSQ22136.1 DUSAM domain-containing protein [Pyxidicoccus parkwaysis]
MTEEADWGELRALAEHIEAGEPLVLSEAVRGLLTRTAQQVGLTADDADQALASQSGAVTLLREVYRRIQDGSDRLSHALLGAYRLRDTGNTAEARKLFERLLSIEVVPLYRQQAELAIRDLEAGRF